MKTVIEYEVCATEIFKGKETFKRFNRNLSQTYEQAKDFALHLKNNCSDYYKDVKIITIKLQVLEETEEKI